MPCMLHSFLDLPTELLFETPGLLWRTHFHFLLTSSKLSRSSCYHLRRLHVRSIRRSISIHIFSSMVHAFVCSRIVYCKSLLIGLPKSSLAPIQYVLNAQLIARIPRFFHIYTFMTDMLH